MQIPREPGELGPGWLTAALRRGGTLDRACVSAVTAEPAFEGEGLFGRMFQLGLEYDRDEGAPSRLVAKLSASNAAMRERPNTIAAHVREVRFYLELAASVDLPTPRCYYADVDEQTGWHVVLLEDLSPARAGSAFEACSAEQARLAVERVVDLHAVWWGSPALHEIYWLQGPELSDELLERAHAGWWPDFLAQARHRLPEPLLEAGASLGRHRGEIFRRLFFEPPQTLIHRDYSLSNLLFASPEGGIPFAVIDWQSVTRGRGVWDVAYFLGQSIDTELRRAVEPELLRGYVDRLHERGVEGYEMEDCLVDYRYALLQRFGALISTIAAMPFTPDQIQRHVDVLLPRNIAAMLDHDAVSLLA